MTEELYTPQFRNLVRMLNKILDLHMSQEITLPDGSWGRNCVHCDGWEYPCATVALVLKHKQ